MLKGFNFNQSKSITLQNCELNLVRLFLYRISKRVDGVVVFDFQFVYLKRLPIPQQNSINNTPTSVLWKKLKKEIFYNRLTFFQREDLSECSELNCLKTICEKTK